MARTLATDVAGGSNQHQRDILAKFQVALTDALLNSGGLAIGSGSKKKILVASTLYAILNGVLVKKTTAELTLTTAHNVANAKFNVLMVSMDAAGVETVTAGTEGATLGAVIFPALASGSVCLGFVIINPSGTGGFVGGTTDLDDATVVPNAVYINSPFPFGFQNLLTL